MSSYMIFTNCNRYCNPVRLISSKIPAQCPQCRIDASRRLFILSGQEAATENRKSCIRRLCFFTNMDIMKNIVKCKKINVENSWCIRRCYSLYTDMSKDSDLGPIIPYLFIMIINIIYSFIMLGYMIVCPSE